jgi:hypothetical protein
MNQSTNFQSEIKFLLNDYRWFNKKDDDII